MRKLFFFAILAIGAGIGLLVAIAAKGEWGAGAVMVGIGLLFAVPVASALTGIGRGSRCPCSALGSVPLREAQYFLEEASVWR